MEKKIAKLVEKTCTSEKYNKTYSRPMQLHDKIYSTDIHRLTIVENEEHGQFPFNNEWPPSYALVVKNFAIEESGVILKGKTLSAKIRDAVKFNQDRGSAPMTIEKRESGLLFKIVKSIAGKAFLSRCFFVPCDTSKWEPEICSINARYLKDAADCLDEFFINKKATLTPFQIKSENLTHYIMPLRI